jgi:hypothetical protein
MQGRRSATRWRLDAAAVLGIVALLCCCMALAAARGAAGQQRGAAGEAGQQGPSSRAMLQVDGLHSKLRSHWAARRRRAR